MQNERKHFNYPLSAASATEGITYAYTPAVIARYSKTSMSPSSCPTSFIQNMLLNEPTTAWSSFTLYRGERWSYLQEIRACGVARVARGKSWIECLYRTEYLLAWLMCAEYYRISRTILRIWVRPNWSELKYFCINQIKRVNFVILFYRWIYSFPYKVCNFVS